MDSPSRTPNATNSGGAPTPGQAGSASLRPGAQFSSNREIAVVQADYLALANDLEQAQALASELELQLSGKQNELASLKGIWERTSADLAKFAHDLDTMRKERHALANEVQKGYAYEHKYERLKTSHDELTATAVRLEAELIRERAAHIECRAELEQLRAASGKSLGAAGGNARDPELRRALEALRTQLDRVLGAPAPAAHAEPQSRLKTAALDRIDIEFSA
jgi:chromosome segregation ATPase